MSLRVWLPLISNTKNLGLCGDNLITSNVTFNDGGKIGNKYLSGGSITIPASISKTFFNKNHMSFTFWLYPIGSTSSSVIMGRTSMSAGDNRMYSIFQYSTPNDLHLSWQDETSSSTFLGGSWPSFFPADTWTHCCIVYNGEKVMIYRNGELYTTANGTSNRNNFEYDFPIVGSPIRKLNDVRIYDHALSPLEVKEISKGLILHYPLADAYVEDTTNLNTRVNMNTSTDSVWGGHSTTTTIYDCTNEPVPFNSGNKIEITYPVGSNTGGGTSVNLGINIPVVSSTVYTLSVYLKASDNFNYWTPNFIYYYGDSAGHGIFNITNKEYIGKGWYRIWGTLTTGSSQTTLNPYFYSYPGTNKTYYIGGWQLEQKDHMTPFVSFGTNRDNSIIYDCSGFCNNGSKWAYDANGEIVCTNDTPKYKISTYINSADNTTSTASGTQYIYGNCELTTPQYLTVAFWCKPVAGYGNQTGQGQFSLTKNAIGTSAGQDYDTSPMNHRDSMIDMCTSSGTHKTVSIVFTANEWHHYVIVYDGRYGRVYKDGVATGATLDMGSVLPLKDMKGAVIGFSKAGGVWRSNKSYYSDFRIYATALSADDVKSLYQNSAYIDNQGNIYGAVYEEV